MLPRDANTDSPNAYDRPVVPPFRFVYLGLWAVVAVAWIAMSLTADAVFGRIDIGIGSWAERIITGVSDIGFCGLLVGAGIVVRFSRAAGIRSLRPGHWILVNFVIYILLGRLLSPIWRWNWPSESSTSLMMLVIGLAEAMCGFLFLYALVKLDDAQRWKSSFAAMAVALLTCGVFSLLLAWRDKPSVVGALSMVLLFGGVLSLLFAVMSILVAISDDLRSKSRDWLHWVGVAALALAALADGLWELARWLRLP
jgi:hypothetical protein